MSLTMYIRYHCYMFRPHIRNHQAKLIIWGDHCTAHFLLSTLRHIVVVVVVVNLLRRVFPSYLLAAISVFVF
jgi:hypothetical protein